MNRSKYLSLIFFIIFSGYTSAQLWTEKMQDNQVDFFEVQEEFNEYWGDRDYERGKGFRQYKRWEWINEPRSYPTGERPPSSIAFEERNKFEEAYPSSNQKSTGWEPWGPSSWTAISSGYNPGNGRVNFVVEDPNDSQIIYVGTPSGGLWKTTDGGADWEPLTDHFTAIGVTGIAINPQNPQEIYIATGDGFASNTYSIGVYKSTDGGDSWNPTGMSHNVTDFQVSRRLKMHPNDPNTLLLATNQGLFKTNDGGNNWNTIETGNFRDIEFHPTNPDIVYVCTKSFMRSTDGGDNFTVISSGTPPTNEINRMELAVSADDPNRVYAVCGAESDASFYGLYRSDDAGMTFSLTANTPNLFGYAVQGDDQGGQSWYDLAIAADPQNADHVFIGGVNVWETTDGGNTFEINSHWVYPTTYNYTHADIHALEYYGNRLYCGSDGGIFVSNNQGEDFIDLSQGLEITQFYRIGGSPQNPSIAIGGTQDNGSNVFDGNHWVHVMGADGMQARIDPSNPSIMYCTQQFGNLHASYDNGNNWSFVFNGDFENGGWVTPYELNSDGDIYIGYENVWLSTDNGATFSQFSTSFNIGNINCLSLAKSDDQTVYVSFENEIYRTVNNGTSWDNITSNLPNNHISDIEVHPTDKDIVYVTLSGYASGNKIFVTTNGGSSWENISQNLPNLPANAIAFQENSNGGIYIGMDVGIYYTDSTLSNWQSYDDDLPNVIITDLEIHYGANHLKAGTYGRGLWVSDLFSPSPNPPEANFDFEENIALCSGDSMTFQDLSINAEMNWTWYFPGGSPSISNDQEPSVTYSSSGTYEVSLVVSNQFGTDSIAKTVNINIGGETFNLDLTTDSYPEETSWDITDENGDVVSSGGNYELENAQYLETVCLDSGCYVFTIYDTFGDGICCDWGDGAYIIEVNGEVIAQGGDFESSEEVTFCVESESDLSVGANLDDQFSIKLFPNPAQDELNVIPSENMDEYDLVIFDAMGKVVHRESSLLGSTSLNVEPYNIGTYFVRISNEEGIFREKIQIMR